MDGTPLPPDRRIVTTPIVVSAVFVAACAVFAVSFVGARGGLQLPVASRGPVAVASDEPSEAVETPPTETAAPTLEPTIEATPAPTPEPTPVVTVAPTLAPTEAPPFVRPTLPPGDPLRALPGCEEHPGCFVYVIQRGDTLSGIISRYRLDFDVLAVLNPQLSDPNVIVVGRTLYLGRDPTVRLDPCPDGAACVLYVVVAGDSVADIASRYGVTSEQIFEANPGMQRPIVPGEVLRLPLR